MDELDYKNHHLSKKRKKVILIILATVCGSATVAATPKDNLDVAKQVFLTISDVAMCMLIWDIYFQENLYKKNIKSILLELFFVIIVSGMTAYMTSKAITVFSVSLIESLGMLGWVIIGAIAALAASLLGIFWGLYCDDLYRSPEKQ